MSPAMKRRRRNGGDETAAMKWECSIKNIAKTTNLNERRKAMKEKLHNSMYTYVGTKELPVLA